MKKQDVIERLCQICSEVRDQVFQNRVASDCFCGENPLVHENDFQFEAEVLDFIANAVADRVEQHVEKCNKVKALDKELRELNRYAAIARKDRGFDLAWPLVKDRMTAIQLEIVKQCK